MIFQFSKILVLCLLFRVIHPNKLQDSIPPYQIRTLGTDGAWLWFNNESVLIDANAIYIGSEDSKGNSQVLLYRINDQSENNRYLDYNLSTWEEKSRKYPSHNYPSLLKLSNGNLLAVYHKSASKMFYRIAQVLDHGTDKQRLKWGQEVVLDLHNGMNYNNLIQLSGENNRLYNFFSISKRSPAIIISEDNGETWGEDSLFMGAGKNGTSPYLKYADNGKDRIDILYTNGHPRNESENSIYHIYYKEGNFYHSDGTLLCSIDQAMKEPFSPDLGTKVYDGSKEGPGWVWDLEYDCKNNPVATMISSADGAEGNDLRYRYAKWNPQIKRWEEKQIAFAGTHLYVPENHFAGGIAIDPENENVVYISTNVNPESGKLNKTQRYQIFRGVTKDNGNSWKWEQLTFDTEKDNLRPIVPRNHEYEICVIWFSLKTNDAAGFESEVFGILK